MPIKRKEEELQRKDSTKAGVLPVPKKEGGKRG